MNELPELAAIAPAARGAPTPPPGSRARMTEMASLRAEGVSLAEIAARFDVSRERVRQILDAFGGPDPGDVAAAKRRRTEACVDARIDELLVLWRAGENVVRAASRLGLPASACRAAIARCATPVDRAARRASLAVARTSTTYSDDDLHVALAHATRRLGHAPTAKEYDVLARMLGLPSLATVLKRLGGWSRPAPAAVPSPAARTRHRRWTPDACREAVRRAADELGEIPSVAAYERLARGRADLPSSSTIRNRLGRWSVLAARVAAQRELAQQSQARARSSAQALAGP